MHIGEGGSCRAKAPPPPIQIKIKRRKLYSHHDVEHFTWFTLKLKLADEYHLEHIKFITFNFEK
jgi:hypothetical protein